MSAEGEVSKVITLYAHLLDDRRFDDLGELLTDDAIFEVRGRQQVGRAEIVASIKGMQSGARGKHMNGFPVVHVVDEATALAWTDMIVVMPRETGFEVTFLTRYYDQLRRIGDRWLISVRRMISPGEEPPSNFDLSWMSSDRLPEPT